MLGLRPNCELCDRDLPPAATDARICSYECTFCADCADTVLRNVCPNCGGNLVPRPIRPKGEWRKGTGLSHHPASEMRVFNAYSAYDRAALTEQLKSIPPERR